MTNGTRKEIEPDNDFLNMTKKFDGELNWIDPTFLITEGKFNKTESFFLGLGTVFNDLKGLILFEKMLMDTYEKPAETETTNHAGNYSGILMQVQKLIASTINEFFVFLKKNNEIFGTTEFKEILSRLSNSNKQYWEAMVAAAHGRLPSVTDFLSTVVKVRSNVTFHYDHSGKILRNAYISRFFGDDHSERNKYAFYSIGESIELTRFFFSDAAVEESLYIAAGKKPKKISMGDPSLSKYQAQTLETVQVMGAVITSILKNYIQSRRNRPHVTH